MTTKSKILAGLAGVFVLIQFYRHDPNIQETPAKNHLNSAYTIPANVEQILVNACYDCHSNNTAYPWYSQVQPLAYWINHHIEDGKKHLNFDEFTTYKLRKQYHKMEEVVEQMQEKEMPLKSYSLIHSNARLKDEERTALVNWAEAVMNEMKGRYPIDSLVKPKS